MCVDRFHIVSLFLSNTCTPSTLFKEAFVYFVCPTEIPQPPFAWKYYLHRSKKPIIHPCPGFMALVTGVKFLGEKWKATVYLI